MDEKIKCPECGNEKLKGVFGTVTYNSKGVVSGRFRCANKHTFGYHKEKGYVK